jgi:hypothetical protein
MKKNSILLIFILFSLAGFSQVVIWLPGNGSKYGDKMQIKYSDNDYIENQFIGYNLGEIIATPTYYLNGFSASADYFEWQDNNSLYVSRLSYPKLFAVEDVNMIVISYLTSDDVLHFDTALYYYSKPVLDCQLVNGTAYIPGMVVVNPADLTFNVVIKSSLYNESQIIGDDYIKEIYQTIDGDTTLNIDNPDTRYLQTSLEVNIAGLTPGLHEIELFAKGRKSDNSFPDEFSESVKIRVLKFDFVIENDNDYSVCKCDCKYFLSGLPEGGIFSGESVLESSNVFDPQRVTGSSSEITYSYPVDNIYYSVTRTINFDPLPVISLDAQPQAGFPHEVCGFEHGVSYELSGSGYVSLDWSLPNISPDNIIKKFYFDGENKVIIDWDQSGNGTISVTATSDKGCTSTLDYMIHISDVHKAPIDSAYVTGLDKMLFCDADTNIIKFFYWHGIKGPDTIPVTTKPYIYIGYKPQSGDSFYVSTALDESSCTTDSHIYTLPKSQNDLKEPDQSSIKIFPNPTNGDINCEFLAPFSNGLIIITNLVGQEIDKVEYNNIAAGDIVRLETDDYQRGIYFLNFSNDSITRCYKFIVY